MRVLHAATHEYTGAGRAAARTHAAIRKAGVADSRLLVLYGDGSDDGTEVLGRGFARRVATLRRMVEERLLALQGAPDGAYRTLGLPGAPGLPAIRRERPDLVHLHWIPGLLGIADLPRIAAPVVWTLHDAWPICGAEHYTEATRAREGYLAANRAAGSTGIDLDRWTWERKRRLWAGFTPTLVCTSRWMADEVRSSALFRGREVHLVPNPLDLSLYRPQDRAAARAAAGLPPGRTLVLFSAWGATTDRRKGFHVLEAALARLSADPASARFELAVLGATGSGPVGGVPAHWLGTTGDEAALRRLYAACDAIAIPSLQDNYPNTLVEAMACGLPAVASDTGGIPDLVRNGETGLLVPPGNAERLAAALGKLASDAGLRARLSSAARETVERTCAEPVVAARYDAIYREAAARYAAR